MEKDIRNNKDLRDAYIILLALSKFIPEKEKTDKCKQSIINYKRAIRRFNKIKNNITYCGGDRDRYVVLIEFPQGMTMSEAKRYFEENYRMYYYPSPYDCTGQQFTTGVKFFKRRGENYCYHTINADV